MGLFSKILAFSIVLTIVYVSLALYNIAKSQDVPVIKEKYWGPETSSKAQNTDITPMKITFSDKMIEDLKHRLSSTRYTPPLEGIAHQYGFNTNLLGEIVDFWLTKYAFKEREVLLNRYPHFKTNIQGLDIHFIHVKPKNIEGVTIFPLLLLHGWPSSFKEYFDLIPLLTTKRPNHNFVFEVIIPSLPGFAYSQAAAKPGCGSIEMGSILKNLMLRLGHEKFYLQGGDWGSIIVTDMAANYREHVLGVHSTMCFLLTPLSFLKLLAGALYPSAIVDAKYQDRCYPLYDLLKIYLRESGYYHIQATKPDTVGVGLNDSPSGLAAYILEKFISGTNINFINQVDGGLKQTFKYEDLLDNIMIYWVTNSMTSAMRIYSKTTAIYNQRVPIIVPSACSHFRHEILYTPEKILRDRFINLVHNTHYDIGGHFIGMEMPDKLSEDVYNAVEKMEEYHKQKSAAKPHEL